MNQAEALAAEPTDEVKKALAEVKRLSKANESTATSVIPLVTPETEEEADGSVLVAVCLHEADEAELRTYATHEEYAQDGEV